MPILAVMRAAPPVDYAAMPIDEARAVWNRGVAPWCALAPAVRHVETSPLPGPAGPMRARLYRATDGILPLVVFVHGGGWTFGSVDSHEGEMRSPGARVGRGRARLRLSAGAGASLSRALDDVLAVIAGVRSGRARRCGGRQPPRACRRFGRGQPRAGCAVCAARRRWARPCRRGALLWLLRARAPDSASHRLFGDGDFGLTTSRMRWYWRNFLGNRERKRRPPMPLRSDAELAGLPPLYLVAAGLDPLRDDTLALAKRLAVAGVSHDLEIVPGVIHGFLGRAPRLPAAQRALASAGAFLARALANKD